jgi:carbon storage regulator CsrA
MSAGHCEASVGRAVVGALPIAASRRRLSWENGCGILSGSLAVNQKSRGGEMQMITRRVNEGLVIENDIHVTVLDICQDYVRIAISSPNNTPPYREETLYWDEAEHESAPELLLQ